VPGGLPSQLNQLTYLLVGYKMGCHDSAGQFQQLSTLTELRELTVQGLDLRAPSLFECLSDITSLSQMSYLKLQSTSSGFHTELNSFHSTALASLTALKQLWLGQDAVQPIAAAALTQLQSLALRHRNTWREKVQYRRVVCRVARRDVWYSRGGVQYSRGCGQVYCQVLPVILTRLKLEGEFSLLANMDAPELHLRYNLSCLAFAFFPESLQFNCIWDYKQATRAQSSTSGTTLFFSFRCLIAFYRFCIWACRQIRRAESSTSGTTLLFSFRRLIAFYRSILWACRQIRRAESSTSGTTLLFSFRRLIAFYRSLPWACRHARRAESSTSGTTLLFSFRL
jgi:hypothetical protein